MCKDGSEKHGVTEVQLSCFNLQSNTIINTAILTSQPVSLPVIVLAVGQDGKVPDVTTAVKCHSANEDIVKVCRDFVGRLA